MSKVWFIYKLYLTHFNLIKSLKFVKLITFMKKIIFMCCIINALNIFSQENNNFKDYLLNSIDGKPKTWGIGLSFRNYHIINETVRPSIRLHFPIIAIRGYYNFFKNTTLGLEYSHQPIWGTGIDNTLHFFYTGPYLRYDILRKKNRIYGQLGYKISNLERNGSSVQNAFPTNYLTFGLGIKAKLRPNIYFNYSHIAIYNPRQSFKERLSDKQIGIEFYYNKKQKDTPFFVSNNKKNRSNKYLVAAAGAFLPFDEKDYEGGYNIFEFTQRFGYYQSPYASFGLFTSWVIGNSRLPNTSPQHFYYFGPFINFKIFPLKRFNYVIEFSYLASNFTAKDGLTLDPPIKGYSEYFLTSLGPAFRITDNLSIEILGAIGRCVRSPYNCNGGGIGGYRIGLEKTFKMK